MLFIYVPTAFQASQAHLNAFLGLRNVVRRNSHTIKFSVKSLRFFLLDMSPKPIFGQVFLRKAKLARGCYNCKKVLQTPKVVLKLPSTNRNVYAMITITIGYVNKSHFAQNS